MSHPSNPGTVPCPICARQGLHIDDPRTVPVLMNRTYGSRSEAREAPRAVLWLARCGACGFVWNTRFDATAIRYDADYENDQTHSAGFQAHLTARARDVVQSAAEAVPLRVLEVGCGQGRFLAEIARQAEGRPLALEGFDPSWRGPEGVGPDGARIHRAYFEARTASRLQQVPDIVVTRHTIEHVPDPVAFLSTIRAALGPGSRATILVETPCVDWIFAQEAVQDFCYEHCSLFGASSLALAMARAGFEPMQVDHVFSGQYLWARGQAAAAPHQPAPALSADLPQLDRLRRAFVDRWHTEVAQAAAAGPVALWGASTKGVTFALLTDPQGAVLDHVVDINPAKQGRHMGMTGLPILSPEASARRAPRTIFLMNPNYRAEVAQRLADFGSAARLVSIN